MPGPDEDLELSGPHVLIRKALYQLERFRNLGADLDVTVEGHGEDVLVQGSELEAYLERLDPPTWSSEPEHSRGNA